jgi:hypothetical protein
VLIGAMGTALAGSSIHLAHEYHAYTAASLFDGTQFQAGGWLPLTLGLAWLAVGIAAGAATRRVLVAIAVVGGLWIVRMVAMVQLRPRLMAAETVVKPLDLRTRGDSPSAVSFANDMGINNGSLSFVDVHGATHSPGQVVEGWCNSANVDVKTCIEQHGIIGSLVKFQPAGRMGTFHLIENGMNLGLAVIALVVAWWCVKKARTTVG